jgi:hypothetical protein
MPRTTTETRKHYHVIVNMAGYMPDGDPEYYTSRRAAEAGAIWHKEQFLERDQQDAKGRWVPGYQVTGSARKGGFTAYRLDDGEVQPTTLPMYITIEGPCRDAVCAGEELDEIYD